MKTRDILIIAALLLGVLALAVTFLIEINEEVITETTPIERE